MKRLIFFLCVLSIVSGIALLTYLAAVVERVNGDEILSIDTADAILAGRFPVYCLNQSYMVCVQEYIACGLFFVFDKSLLLLRVPPLIFTLLGALATFRLLWISTEARYVLLPVAVGIIPNSAIAAYVGTCLPEYGFASFFVPFLFLLSMWVQRNRTVTRYLLYGAYCGVGVAVFRLLAFPVMCSSLYLLTTSDAFRRLSPNLRSQLNRKNVILIGVTLLLAAPGVYLHLGRRPIHPDALRGALVVAGAFALATATGVVFKILPSLSRREIGIICLVSLLVIVPTLVAKTAYYRTAEEVTTTASPRRVRYILKQYPDWPGQFRILNEEVIPDLLIGDLDTIKPGVADLGPVTLLSVFWHLVVLVMVGCIGWTLWFQLERSDVLFWWLLSVVVFIPVFFPSWSLFGDYSYRYLIPFWPAIIFGVFRAIPVSGKKADVLAILLWGAVVTWNVYNLTHETRTQGRNIGELRHTNWPLR